MEKFVSFRRTPVGLQEYLSKNLELLQEVSEHSVEDVGRRKKTPIANQRWGLEAERIPLAFVPAVWFGTGRLLCRRECFCVGLQTKMM